MDNMVSLGVQVQFWVHQLNTPPDALIAVLAPYFVHDMLHISVADGVHILLEHGELGVFISY